MNYRIENHLAEPAGRASFGSRSLIATAVLLASCLPFGAQQASAADSPLMLEKSITIPDVPLWPYSDVMSIDVAGKRLFATPQAAKAVAVLDMNDGRVLKMLPGIVKPHGVFYSPTLKRLFVADGASGDVKVFNGEDYSLIKTIPLAVGADAIVYDPHSQLIYVTNGGDDAGMDHALLSVVDPVRMVKVADIPIASTDLEGIAISPEKELVYVSLVEDSAIAVVDLRKRQVVGTWKLPAGNHSPFALAFDATLGRLYVACHDDRKGMNSRGTLFVLDTANGRPVATLSIGGWTDGVLIDQKRQRIYVTTGVGRLETYSIAPHDEYHRLADVDIPLIAKHSLYSSELDRVYVDVPHLAPNPARVLVFKPSP